MSDEEQRCANPACRIAETGKCVEGLDLAECPHFGQDTWVELQSDEHESPVEESPPPGVPLIHGDALKPEEAIRFLRRSDARVAAIIGPRETGKTSLVAGLYDLFQTGALSEISFGRTETFPAFEIACHDARAASRRGVPHMNRTPRGEVRFYHLDLFDTAKGQHHTLLLADRSGEEYSDTTHDLSSAHELIEMRRADSVTILVDGERLLDVGRRHNIRADVMMIMHSLIEAGSIRRDHRVAVVLTKVDLIVASMDNARAQADFKKLVDDIESSFGDKIGSITSFEIAASPKGTNVIRGTGLAGLLAFWLIAPQSLASVYPVMTSPRRAFARVRPIDEEND